MSEARDPRELLALLAAKPQHFAAAPGGIPGLTPDDIAGALGMMPNAHARLLARVKYAGHYMFLNELLLELFVESSKLDRFIHMKKARPEFLRDLCRVAVWNSITDNVCLWCKGVGSIKVPPKPIVCQACRGKGRREPRDSDLAHAMDMSRAAFSEGKYGELYKDIAAILSTWDSASDGFRGHLWERRTSRTEFVYAGND